MAALEAASAPSDAAGTRLGAGAKVDGEGTAAAAGGSAEAWASGSTRAATAATSSMGLIREPKEVVLGSWDWALAKDTNRPDPGGPPPMTKRSPGSRSMMANITFIVVMIVMRGSWDRSGWHRRLGCRSMAIQVIAQKR